VQVRGYYRPDGTYVPPHTRTAPDGNFDNNWSTVGNVNPHTGKAGTKTTPPADYGQDVWVNDYYRSDGTYVPGHYRSAPDGAPSNNWSTRGNVNPYTGVPGSQSYDNSVPPSSYRSSGPMYYEPDRTLRQAAADRLFALGEFVDWHDYRLEDLEEIERRLLKVEELKQYKIKGDWREHTSDELTDWANRALLASNLKEQGVKVDWSKYSYEDLCDMETRVRLARELSNLGAKADWKKQTWQELYDCGRRVRKAKELKAKGIKADWRRYSWEQLLKIEQTATLP
jgi:hypothetical protein